MDLKQQYEEALKQHEDIVNRLESLQTAYTQLEREQLFVQGKVEALREAVAQLPKAAPTKPPKDKRL